MVKKYLSKYKRRARQSKVQTSILKSRFLWLGILALFFIAFLVYGFFFSGVFTIKSIEIAGNRKIETEKIREIVQDNAHHFILLNINKLGAAVLDEFPEIREITIKKKPLNALEVIVRERRGIAVWCKEEEKCYAIDSQGIMFEEREVGEFLPLVGFSGRLEANLGDKIISEESLTNLLLFDQKIKRLLEVFQYTIVSEDRMNVEISEGWDVYVALQENIEWQTDKLQAVLEKNIPEEQRYNLEYIDLRFGDQAFIKYK